MICILFHQPHKQIVIDYIVFKLKTIMYSIHSFQVSLYSLYHYWQRFFYYYYIIITGHLYSTLPGTLPGLPWKRVHLKTIVFITSVFSVRNKPALSCLISHLFLYKKKTCRIIVDIHSRIIVMFRTCIIIIIIVTYK